MNVYILSALSTYLPSIEIVRTGYGVKGIIGLSDNVKTEDISGYCDYRDYCMANNIFFHPVDTYGLTSAEDKNQLNELKIDVLLVLGWQRLIPRWLIEKCGLCAIGAHGSSDGITMGRGRSPQNWALLLGKHHFYISIFRIDEGIDSGAVIDTRRFEYNEFDTIQTSYYKVSWLTGEMIVDCLRSGLLEHPSLAHEQQGEARYLPQRRPEDGEIDWNRTSKQIHDFVRAQSQPYPGAFSRISDSGLLKIWRGAPFEFDAQDLSASPGQIVKRFPNDDLVIMTGKGYFIAHDWTVEDIEPETIQQGILLPSIDFPNQIIAIVTRHYEKYPNHTLSDDILSLLP